MLIYCMIVFYSYNCIYSFGMALICKFVYRLKAWGGSTISSNNSNDNDHHYHTVAFSAHVVEACGLLITIQVGWLTNPTF